MSGKVHKMKKLLLCLIPLGLFAGDHRFGGESYYRHLEMIKHYDNQKHEVPFWERKYFTGDWGGVRERLTDRGVTITSSYVSNLAGNPTGGEKQGFTQTGSWGADLTIDFSKFCSWEGLVFYTSSVWRGGSSLSLEYINNQFPVQQVYGGQNFRLVSMYLQQEFWDQRIRIRAGRLCLGDTFYQSPLYYQYMSNAFDGNPIGIFFNGVFTAYPNATWGAYFEMEPIDRFMVKFAVYNANDTLKKNKYHGCNFTFASTEGAQLITEWSYLPNTKKGDSGLPGHYKIGGYYFTGSREKFSTGREDGNWGFFLLADQMVYREEGDPFSDLGLTPFVAIEYTPRNEVAKFPFFFTAGMVYKGLIPHREEDTTSIGIAYGTYSDKLRQVQEADRQAGVPGKFGNRPQNFETVLELNHWFQINKWWYIMPDIQYVINPKGLGNLNNALVLGAQIGFEL